MSKARWAKWRAQASTRPDPEPKMLPWRRFRYGVQDKLTGETHWRDLTSVRQAAKALSLISKYIP